MQRWLDVVLFCACAAASVTGLVIMKSSLPQAQTAWLAGNYLAPWTFAVGGGAAIYAASFLIWLGILARNDLSVAYPVVIGLTLIFLIGAAKMLGELISLSRAAGMLIILIGIWLVTRA